MGIIYLVENKVNKKKYIGQTIQTFTKRKNDHIAKALRKATNTIFHNAIRKYGVDNFRWCVLWEGDVDVLDEMEIYYIKEYDTYFENKKGYNMTFGGGGIRGLKHSDEAKAKMSKSRKGKKLSPEHKAKALKYLNPQSGADNRNYNSNTYSFIHTGKDIIVHNITMYEFNKTFKLNRSNLTKLVNGKLKSHKGWMLYSAKEK